MSFVRVQRRAKTLPAPEAACEAAPDADIAGQVREEVTRLRAAAEAAGRAQGLAEGRALAKADFGPALETAAAALRAACAQLSAPLAQCEHDLADMVTELAFELARHIVGLEVQAGSGSLKTLVARLIREAAAERHGVQNIVVRVHPDDFAALAETVDTATGQLIAEPSISRGGALVEILAEGGDPIDKIEWDATLETRFGALKTSLGLRGAEARTL